MTSQLEAFRNHCRRMAESAPTTRVKALWDPWSPLHREHVAAVGAMNPSERQLWARLADEIDDFLTTTEDPNTEPLWEQQP